MTMNDSSILWRYSLFDGLEREEVDRVINLMDKVTFEPGVDIVVEGGSNNKIHFIVEGHVIVYKGGLDLMELHEGSIFGEMEVLEVLPVEATIRTVTTTKVMTLSVDALGEIYESDLKIYSFIIMNLARDLARRVRRLNVRMLNDFKKDPNLKRPEKFA